MDYIYLYIINESNMIFKNKTSFLVWSYWSYWSYSIDNRLIDIDFLLFFMGPP